MIAKTTTSSLFLFAFLLSLSICALGQSQTTGRIVGTVQDERAAVIVGAQVTVTSLATAEVRKVTTDTEGNYSALLLPPGTYSVRVVASGFALASFHTQIF